MRVSNSVRKIYAEWTEVKRGWLVLTTKAADGGYSLCFVN